MASASKGPWDDIELDEIPDLTELPEQVVEQAKDKEWKTLGAEGVEKVVAKCQRSKRKKKMTPEQIKNLVQYREKDERTEESKQASMEQLRVPVRQRQEEDDAGAARVEFPSEILEPDILRSALTIPEQEYFVRRWQEYMDEHGGDFNRAEDYDAVAEMIICYINLYRIEKRKKNSPGLQVDFKTDTVTHNLHLRIGNLRRDLKTSRKARLETQENKESNLMRLMTEYAKNGQSRLGKIMEDRLIQQATDEDEMLRRKRERILPHRSVIDVEVLEQGGDS